MDVKNTLPPLKYRISRLIRREDGSSIIELAIVFPILLIMFVGTAELGRLFYTYTSLAKATTVGARYLSTSRDATSSDANKVTAAKLAARNLVVYGCKSRDPAVDLACSAAPPILPGLSPANVNICDNFSVACSTALAGGTVKYFRVEIINYTPQPGEFNLATMTGKATSTFYFALAPGTEMRYMP
jgi:Flp pilus assembly protein TadG